MTKTHLALTNLLHRAALCRRSKVAVGALAASVVAGWLGAGNPVLAAPDFSCMKSIATGVHPIRKPIGSYPPYIAWQVKPTMWTYDRCQKYGDITVSVAVVDDDVRARGGMITLEAWVRYYDVRTNAAGQWIPLKQAQTWPTVTFRPPNLQNISMNSATATNWVAIRSTFWLKKDASNWVPMSQAWTYCRSGSVGLQNGTPTPGPCHGG